MAGHYLRKRLRTAGLARRAASFALILLGVSVLVFRFGGVDFRAFAILLGIVASLATLAFLLGSAGLVRVWRSGHNGGGAALAAVLIALVVGTPYALGAALALRNPPTNMAETDGIAEEEAQASGSPGDAAFDADDDKVLTGRVYAARASQIYQAVRLAIGDAGWTVTGVETADPQEEDSEDVGDADDAPPAFSGPVPVPTPRNVPGEEASDEKMPDPLDQPESGEYRIKAVALAPILALPSDVEIRIVEDDSQGYLDLKSVSRFGARDFGQNRRFIENFLARVDGAMVGIAAPAGT